MFPEIHTKGELGSEVRVALFHFSTTAIVNLPGFNQYEYSITNNKKIKAVVEDLGQGLRCVVLTLAAEVP